MDQSLQGIALKIEIRMDKMMTLCITVLQEEPGVIEGALQSLTL
jgi:hypothetical protein